MITPKQQLEQIYKGKIRQLEDLVAHSIALLRWILKHKRLTPRRIDIAKEVIKEAEDYFENKRRKK